MNTLVSSFSVSVDVTNSGQFFACCGILELAHRLWPGAEGWFDKYRSMFVVYSPVDAVGLSTLVEKLCRCVISGLTLDQRNELEALEAEKRQLRRERRSLPAAAEQRRVELGKNARQGTVTIEAPFFLALDWWQTEDDEVTTPKTWAGRQEIHKVARAAQDAISEITDLPNMFEYSSVLRLSQEYRKDGADENKAVEPFYFDARRFVHALDTGFSLDVQNAATMAHPAVELLSLIGLQRFRPATEGRFNLAYFAWFEPLSAVVASVVVSGAVRHSSSRRYQFQLRFRDNQRRYKAFSFATSAGEQI